MKSLGHTVCHIPGTNDYSSPWLERHKDHIFSIYRYSEIFFSADCTQISYETSRDMLHDKMLYATYHLSKTT